MDKFAKSQKIHALEAVIQIEKCEKRWGEKAMLETMPISEKLKMLRGRRELTLDELAESNGAFTFGVEQL